MVSFVLLSAIVAFVSSWVWYRYLFPQAAADFGGGKERGEAPPARGVLLTIIGLVILAAAMGTFIRNRGILDNVDVIKLGIKVWFGFLFPIALVAWAHTRATFTTLVATAGFWLLVALEYAILANWLLLG